MKPYFQDDRLTIYHADAREILPELEPVDVVITDPPYFGVIDSTNTAAGVQAEYSANTAVALHLASQMAPAMVLVTSPVAGAAKKVIRQLPLVTSQPWACDGEPAVVHFFGRFAFGLADLGGIRVPIPLEVTERLYEPFAPGVLLDPFMGHGSSLLAAIGAGGSAIGIDIDEGCCETAARRLDGRSPSPSQDTGSAHRNG